MKKNNNKTIAIFSGFFLPFLGGIERYTDKLSLKLVEMGYRIIIITTQNDVNLPETEENNGRKIYRLPTRNLFKNRYPILNKNDEFKKIINQIDKEQIDFIIANTRFHLTTLLGLQIAKNKKIPNLVIEHGSGHFSVGNNFFDFFGSIYEHLLTNKIKKLTKNFYSVSKKGSEWLKHFGISSKGVFYNAVDSNLFNTFINSKLISKNKNTIFILYAGRIIPEKGVDLLLESFSKIKTNKEIKLLIAGDGPALNDLKNKYKSDSVVFLGKLNYNDTMSLMNQSDIFVYPSLYPEGLPTSILEAGMLKNALIATDRGGTREVIDSNDNGIIIEENSESLTNALIDLVNDESKVANLKNNIHNKIENEFTWDKTAIEVSNAIENLSSKK